jgi:hypothetical protein
MQTGSRGHLYDHLNSYPIKDDLSNGPFRVFGVELALKKGVGIPTVSPFRLTTQRNVKIEHSDDATRVREKVPKGPDSNSGAMIFV